MIQILQTIFLERPIGLAVYLMEGTMCCIVAPMCDDIVRYKVFRFIRSVSERTI